MNELLYHYATIKKNDIVDGEGICVSFWTQGCPHHCLGCHNPETHSFDGGYLVSVDDVKKEKTATIDEITNEIIAAIGANGIHRNFSILGGEPMAPQNSALTMEVIRKVRLEYPNIKIFLWSGYTLEELKSIKSIYIGSILRDIDVLIDGRFEQDKRDLTLYLRGSSNQRILYKGIDF